MKFYYFLLFFLLTNMTLMAQSEKNIDNQSILWTRYYNQLLLNEKLSLHTEFDQNTIYAELQQ